MKIYNKLVRDKIPEIIAGDNGKTCVARIMKDDEYLKALNTKMQEKFKDYWNELIKSFHRTELFMIIGLLITKIF